MTNSFDILSKSQTITILENQINGAYDRYSSYLNVPIAFEFRTPYKGCEFRIDTFNAELILTNTSSVVSRKIQLVDFNVNQEEDKTGRIFQFELKNDAIQFIERNRNGDLNIGIKLSGNAHTRTWVSHSKLGIRTQQDSHIVSFTTVVSFVISQSDWLKVLKDLNYNTFKLIELPLTHKTLNEAYDNIVSEFNLAEQYFNKQDYNKAVAHCRSSMDALTQNLIKIKNNTPSKTAFDWLKTVNKETFNWIDELNKSTSGITSKTHHAGLKRNFEKHEAESIYLVLLGLLNFIGHEKNKFIDENL